MLLVHKVCPPGSEGDNFSPHVLLLCWIQACRRFIQKQDRRISQDTQHKTQLKCRETPLFAATSPSALRITSRTAQTFLVAPAVNFCTGTFSCSCSLKASTNLMGNRMRLWDQEYLGKGKSHARVTALEFPPWHYYSQNWWSKKKVHFEHERFSSHKKILKLTRILTEIDDYSWLFTHLTF